MKGSSMEARPHAVFFPQESRSPQVDRADAPGNRANLSTNHEVPAITLKISKLSRDPDNRSLFSGERVKVRPTTRIILFSTLLFCLAFVSPLLADDVITNFMSSIVSYQYTDDFSSRALTNGGIQSPFVSFEY